MPNPDELADLRASIDNLDAALLALLAERFRVTRKVARYKAGRGLPIVDRAREAAVYERVRRAAAAQGLDPGIAERLWRTLIAESVEDQKRTAAATPRDGGPKR